MSSYSIAQRILSDAVNATLYRNRKGNAMFRDDVESLVMEADDRDECELPSDVEIGRDDYNSATDEQRYSLYVTASAMLNTPAGHGDDYWQGVVDAHNGLQL